VDQILFQLSTLQLDFQLTPEQDGKSYEFSEAARAYVNDPVHQQFKDQSRSHNPNEALMGLTYLAKLVDTSSHRLSGLEEIEFKAKIFDLLLNNEQRVLFDLRLATSLPAVCSPSPRPTQAPSLLRRETDNQMILCQRLMLSHPIRSLHLDNLEKRKFPKFAVCSYNATACSTQKITMTTYPLTALATLLAVLMLFWTLIKVGKARGQYDIKAPATSGHEMFDRAFRVQMNTLESLVIFLPSLWIYGVFVGDLGAGVSGVVWFLARVWFALAYVANPSKRGPGFAISMLCTLGMWSGGLWGVVKVLTS
jgi:glutathione S-transferase